MILEDITLKIVLKLLKRQTSYVYPMLLSYYILLIFFLTFRQKHQLDKKFHTSRLSDNNHKTSSVEKLDLFVQNFKERKEKKTKYNKSIILFYDEVILFVESFLNCCEITIGAQSSLQLIING